MRTAARTFANIRALSTPKPDLDEQRMALLFHRVFASPDGQVVLEYLRQATNYITPADASDSALRMKEGQRQLVARIEGMVLSGERAKS